MINHYLEQFVGYVWSYPVVGLCILTGVFFTFRMLFIQLRCFPHAIALVSGKYDNPNEKGEITHFQALSAALSGTIGLGNIAGVSIAIALGGPGAVLWMWLLGFFGMATKFVECTLGTHFREEDPDTGEVHGGPMYYITKGLGQKWWPLASFYAIAVGFAAFGVGSMFQSNQAASALYEYYSVPHWLTGLILFSLGALVVIGGIKRIGKVASKIVPSMCAIYVLGSIFICLLNIDKLGSVINIIIDDAFSGRAAAGGVMWVVVKMGVRRAIFSNEAGLGSASIAHAAVKTDYPVREGFVASLGPLIDTIIVCTATAMVIILSGNYGTERYESTGKLISFEQNKTYQTIQKTMQFPKQTKDMRAFQNGDYVVQLNNNQNSIVLNDIVISDNSDGVRFSYLKQSGNLSLSLLDNNNNVIDTLLLTETNGKNGLISLSHAIFANEWNASIIEFSDTLKKQLKSNNVVSLRLDTKSANSSWFIDRIEPVRSLQGIELTTKSFDAFFKGFGSIFITFAVFSSHFQLLSRGLIMVKQRQRMCLDQK